MESENIRMGLRKIWSVILLLGILICPAHVWGREALTLSETHVENHQSDSKEQSSGIDGCGFGQSSV